MSEPWRYRDRFLYYLDEVAPFTDEDARALQEMMQRRLDRELFDAFSLTTQRVEPEEPLSLSKLHRMINEAMAGAPRAQINNAMLRPAEHAGTLFGMPLIVSPILPTNACKLGDAPPSKNRSRRLWKKLRKGTRKKPRFHEITTVAYVIGNGPLIVSPDQMAALREELKHNVR